MSTSTNNVFERPVPQSTTLFTNINPYPANVENMESS